MRFAQDNEVLAELAEYDEEEGKVAVEFFPERQFVSLILAWRRRGFFPVPTARIAPGTEGIALRTDGRRIMAAKAMAGVSLALAMAMLVVVLERLFAALFEMYRFFFDWPVPIHLNAGTVGFFGALSLAGLALNGMCLMAIGKRQRGLRMAFLTSTGLMVASLGMGLAMLVARLAIIG